VTGPRTLCRLGDLAASGAKEVVLTKEGGRFPIFIVQTASGIRGYVNSCPHARLPLNAREDQFFDFSRTFLFCANHGAQFDPETGVCIRGPCKGEALKVFPVALQGDTIVIDECGP
jgi:nitrite reductase/ring-hydroxylating ferredoxin subunit